LVQCFATESSDVSVMNGICCRASVWMLWQHDDSSTTAVSVICAKHRAAPHVAHDVHHECST
jgi:hypothetical protein